jgi:hypothetical protein
LNNILIDIIWIFECQHTCKIETKEIADPVSDGGFPSLVFGLAEYAEGDLTRVLAGFNEWSIPWNSTGACHRFIQTVIKSEF